jgi:hypothetical protein
MSDSPYKKEEGILRGVRMTPPPRWPPWPGLAAEVVARRLGGMMVWFSSVLDAATNATATGPRSRLRPPETVTVPGGQEIFTV